MTRHFCISLEDVQLYGHHGVFKQERTVGAAYRVWVELGVALPAGCETDCLDGTISYADVYDVLCEQFGVPSNLLEHLACRIVGALKERWPEILSQRIKIMKVSPPIPCFQGSAAVTYSVEY